MGAERPLTSSERAALRAQGLRPRTFWLPNLNDPAFKAKIAEGCRLVRENDERWADDALWVEAMTDDLLESLPPWNDG